MNTKAKQFRILSFDASRIKQCLLEGKTEYPIKKNNGVIDFTKFQGFLDESLDTIQLEKVYKKHHDAFETSFLFKDRNEKDDTNNQYTLGLINVSFEYSIHDYNSIKTKNGNLYYKTGEDVKPENLIDHVYIQERDGKTILLGVEIPYDIKNLKDYSPVLTPNEIILNSKYFAYDSEHQCYIRRKKVKKPKELVEFKTRHSTSALREELYKNGFFVNGIHYVRYKRSAGSSREGQCLFIPEVLYSEMMEWSSCGIDGETIKDQASFQAYISLTLSSLLGKLNLNKKSILLIKDKESVFDEKVARVTRNPDTNTLNAQVETTTIKNKIWDGEALLDSSLFEEQGIPNKGMMLLRNRFFKTCAFNTNLQKYFEDNGITHISQLKGYYRKGAELKDIKLIITESSLKYCKMFDKKEPLERIFNLWIDYAFEGNTSDFGIVKTEKETNILEGKMVLTNYQFLNTINLTKDDVSKLLFDSLDFLHKMKDDPMYLRYYMTLLSSSEDEFDDSVVLSLNYRYRAIKELLSHNDSIQNTKLYCEFRGDTIDSFKNKLSSGRIAVDGTYATLCGNGAELLYATIHDSKDPLEPIALKGNEIRTTQFAYDKELLCTRSPHITMGNLLLSKNVDNDLYKTYFNFEDAHEIVCINSINHNIMQKLNGCDFDSDTMLITDNPILLKGANSEDGQFLVPVADFTDLDFDPEEYDVNNPKDIATLDSKIANNLIGQIVNLSQYLNCIYWDNNEHGHYYDDRETLYLDICKLAVLSGLEIDKAKKNYNIQSQKIVKELELKYKPSKKEKPLPTFFSFITKNKHTPSKEELNCPMSYIYSCVKEDPYKARKISRYVLVSSLLSYVDEKNPSLIANEKNRILSKAKEVKNNLDNSNRLIHNMKKEDQQHEREEMDREINELLETVNKNMSSDRLIEALLKELEAGEAISKVSQFYSLLLSALVLEERHLLINRMTKTTGPQKDIRFAKDLEAGHILIYGYPHIIQSNE